MKIGWSVDFVVVDAGQCAADALDCVRGSSLPWVVVEREGGRWRYVFGRRELLELQHLRWLIDRGADLHRLSLTEVLNLHETTCSRALGPGEDADAPQPDPAQPSAARFFGVDSDGSVVAVGGADVGQVPRMRGTHAEPPPEAAAPPASARRPAARGSRSRGGPRAGAAPPTSAPAVDDEGTTPMRFPSIEPDGEVHAGATITLVVDLLREESATTLGGTAFPAQVADWTAFDVDVTLQSPDIEFDDGGRGTLTVRRNAATQAAKVIGRVRAGLAAGHEMDVKARFLLGTRFCGSAVRRLRVGAGVQPHAAAAADTAVQVDARAAQPDLTVFITLFDGDQPGRMHWRMVTPPFPGRPARLDGKVDLGQRPAEEATALFKRFDNLERGQHKEAIEGFGEQLWDRAPPEFHAVYWALNDFHRRALTIQFVSDDPHLPWELMSPYRDGEVHGPMALRHAVARWIGHWQGYMRNRLPAGTLVAIAPHYASASARLSLAEAAAQDLVEKFGAQRVPGQRDRLLQLLEQPPDAPVALLYFTGHGAFASDAAGASLIKLEGGASLSAAEVARQRVRLGERHGTVVFLNACEVGASGSVLGNVGGWADAFLSRRFGAFIAPLWAIDEEDAKQVTEDLMAAIVTRREPMGEALRALRERHGAVSPTFYSYLLYGDVTARLGGG
jgi:hypothetical protein